VVEVQGMEGEIITLQDIFVYDYSLGIDEKGKYKGAIKPTGLRPKFISRLNDYGIELPNSIFMEEI
jgi:pilus assembly protein CpaF